MPLVELKKELKLSDLEVGKIFDEDELIVESDGIDMVTLRREPENDEGEIRIFRYDIKTQRDRIIINNNGTCDISPGDRDYLEYDKQLRSVRL